MKPTKQVAWQDWDGSVKIFAEGAAGLELLIAIHDIEEWAAQNHRRGQVIVRPSGS